MRKEQKTLLRRNFSGKARVSSHFWHLKVHKSAIFPCDELNHSNISNCGFRLCSVFSVLSCVKELSDFDFVNRLLFLFENSSDYSEKNSNFLRPSLFESFREMKTLQGFTECFPCRLDRVRANVPVVLAEKSGQKLILVYRQKICVFVLPPCRRIFYNIKKNLPCQFHR